MHLSKDFLWLPDSTQIRKIILNIKTKSIKTLNPIITGRRELRRNLNRLDD